MTFHPDGQQPNSPVRFFLPARILTPVPRQHSAPGRFDQSRAMLRHPGFWLVMAALTAIMFIGALMLSGHLHRTPDLPVKNNGPAYYAMEG
jgi:hypothetical protein